MNSILEVRGLRKSYGSFALNDITLNIKKNIENHRQATQVLGGGVGLNDFGCNGKNRTLPRLS